MSEKINKKDVTPREDACGELRELYSSENLSIAHVIVTGEAKPHKHRKMEEVYYVTLGKGQLVLGDKVLDVKEGDVIPISKNTMHALRKTEGQFEILVTTYPKYDPQDMIFE